MKNRHKYPDNWEEISAQVKAEQYHRCAHCQVPHGATILRGEGMHAATYAIVTKEQAADDYIRITYYSDRTGVHIGHVRLGMYRTKNKLVPIILTTAHLDHNEANNDRANLAALCQACHLRHDAADNARRRKYGTDHNQQQTLF